MHDRGQALVALFATSPAYAGPRLMSRRGSWNGYELLRPRLLQPTPSVSSTVLPVTPVLRGPNSRSHSPLPPPQRARLPQPLRVPPGLDSGELRQQNRRVLQSSWSENRSHLTVSLVDGHAIEDECRYTLCNVLEAGLVNLPEYRDGVFSWGLDARGGQGEHRRRWGNAQEQRRDPGPASGARGLGRRWRPGKRIRGSRRLIRLRCWCSSGRVLVFAGLTGPNHGHRERNRHRVRP